MEREGKCEEEETAHDNSEAGNWKHEVFLDT